MYRIAWIFAATLLGASIAHAASDDQSFVTKASQGGIAEVELGQLALARGQSQAVKAFAQKMVDDHSKANAELATVATAAGASMAAAPSPEQKAVAAKLEGLSGAAFDRAYATQMVDDHEKTVALFEKEAEAGGNAGIKAFAAKTLPTLRTHLEHAKRLADAGT